MQTQLERPSSLSPAASQRPRRAPRSVTAEQRRHTSTLRSSPQTSAGVLAVDARRPRAASMHTALEAQQRRRPSAPVRLGGTMPQRREPLPALVRDSLLPDVVSLGSPRASGTQAARDPQSPLSRRATAHAPASPRGAHGNSNTNTTTTATTTPSLSLFECLPCSGEQGEASSARRPRGRLARGLALVRPTATPLSLPPLVQVTRPDAGSRPDD